MQDDDPFTGDRVTFVLQVTITGLCLLVPTSDDRALWVIMPEAEGQPDGDGGKVPKHVPALRYDVGSTRSGVPVGSPDWKELTPLTKCLQGAAMGDIKHLVRRVNGNQSRKHGKHAPLRWFKDQLSASDEALIAARAVLTGITDLTPWSGKEWIYGDERLELHTAAACIIQDVPGTSLKCSVDRGSLELFPDPTNNTLKVDLCHLPKDELDGKHDMSKPKHRKPPKHWEPYRTLLGVTEDVRPLRPDDDPDVEALGMNPFACMTIPTCPENEPDCYKP
jgi:hypothetical protein